MKHARIWSLLLAPAVLAVCVAKPVVAGGAEDGTEKAARKNLYLVLDIGEGPAADIYPASFLDAVPDGGWSKEFRTEKIVLRHIPPGKFVMGSPEDEAGRLMHEGPAHEVTVSKGFWLGIYPVTQRQYSLVTGQNPSSFEDSGPEAPVERVNWNHARAFCAKLQARLPSALSEAVVRLPREAEWEYAARADTGSSGDEDAAARERLDDVAWHVRNSGGRTRAVGRKKPNGWGLYDILGNVWEWCGDAKRKYTSSSQTDPVGVGWSRVLRGGSWYDLPRFCRIASRYEHAPGFSADFIGFRVLVAP